MRYTKKAIYALFFASSKLYWDGIYDALTNSYRKSYPYRYMNSPLTSIVKLKSSGKSQRIMNSLESFRLGYHLSYLDLDLFIYPSIYLLTLFDVEKIHGNVITNQN